MASWVQSVKCDPREEGLDASIGRHLGDICGYYNNANVLPRLRELAWNEGLQLDGDDVDGYQDIVRRRRAPILFALLSISPRVRTLTLKGLIAPIDHTTWFRDLKSRVTPELHSLSLECIRLDTPDAGFYGALAPIINLPGLEELRLDHVHYSPSQIHPEPNENLRVLTILCNEEHQPAREHLPRLASAAPGLQRLRLGVTPSDFDDWDVSTLGGLFTLKALEEFQLFADGAAAPGGPLLSSHDVQILGSQWRQLKVLNLIQVYDCHLDILEVFAQTLPRLQKLALFFRSWEIENRRSNFKMTELEILCFNPGFIPFAVYAGEGAPLEAIAAYMASVLPPTAKFSEGRDAGPQYLDYFADIIAVERPITDRLYAALLRAGVGDTGDPNVEFSDPVAGSQ